MGVKYSLSTGEGYWGIPTMWHIDKCRGTAYAVPLLK